MMPQILNSLCKSCICYSIIVVLEFFCSSCQKENFKWYTKKLNKVHELPHLNDSTLQIHRISEDYSYGRTPIQPIFLGVTNHHEGGKNRFKFINGLITADGEEVKGKRISSCCPFKTLNSHTVGSDQKFGLLDVWVIWTDSAIYDTLYINPYDEGELIAPAGYNVKK